MGKSKEVHCFSVCTGLEKKAGIIWAGPHIRAGVTIGPSTVVIDPYHLSKLKKKHPFPQCTM